MTGRPGKVSYPAALLIALGIHAGVLFGWPHSPAAITPPEFGVEVASPGVEVTLVAALPEAEKEPESPAEDPKPEPTPESTPEPTPPPAEPEPVPTPEPLPPVPDTPPEVTTPVQQTPAPTPAPQPSEPPPRVKPATPAKPKPKPAQPRQRHAVGDGSSAVPGMDATTAAASTGALSAQPGYLRNPHPAYPEEARRAGQEGVVQLRVNVDESGHVTGVSVTHSSGYPLLDERARSTVSEHWAFKAARRGNTPVAATVIVPIRFSLSR